MNKLHFHSQWCSDQVRKQKNFLLICHSLLQRHHLRFKESEILQNSFLLLVSAEILSYEHWRFSEMQRLQQEHHLNRLHMHMVRWGQQISSIEQNSDSSSMLEFHFFQSLQRCMVWQNRMQERWLKMGKCDSMMFRKHSREWLQIEGNLQTWCEFKQKHSLENGQTWKIDSPYFLSKCDLLFFHLQSLWLMLEHGFLVSSQIASRECRSSQQLWQATS